MNTEVYKTLTWTAILYSCETWPLALENGKCCEDYVADNAESLI